MSGFNNASTFGFFLLLSFLLFMFLVWKRAKENLYPEETVFDSIFLVSFVSLLGARLSYILLHFTDFGFNLIKWLVVSEYPGWYFYGGFLSGLLMLRFIYRRQDKISGRKMLDYFLLAFWSAFALAAIGVGLAGLEAARPINLPFGDFSHPVSFYRAGGALLFLLIYYWKLRKRKLAPGRVGLLSLIAFAVLNFLVDFTKSFGVYYWVFSLDQIIALGIIVCSGLFFYGEYGNNFWRGKLSFKKKQND